jgi:thiamine-phosphate pyrophosphorylase
MTSRPNKVEPRPKPRLYLVTPLVADADAFAAQLAAALERSMINTAKALGRVVQDRQVAVLLDGHADLVARAGADGAHLAGLAEFTEALEQLKPDRIAGAGRMETRHDAMTAAELGCDYVMFGEPDDSGERPAFDAIEDRVSWWAEVFEAPCVGFAASASEVEPLVKAGADFIALGDWIWADPQTVSSKIADAARFLIVPETTA